MVDGLGPWLRRARENRQLSLRDVESALRIRSRYLQALEVGDYTTLPGVVQARGFLRNYARYLGLPVEEALARYEAEITGSPVQPRDMSLREEASGRQNLRSWAPPPPTVAEEIASTRVRDSRGLINILLGVIVVFMLIAGGSYLALRSSNSGASESSANVDSAQATLPPTPISTQSATPVFPVSIDGTVRVRVIPNSSAWISISADNQVVFQGIAEVQQALEAVAQEVLIVATGNGGAFQLYVNGTDWGLLGEQGEVVRRAWSPEGEMQPEDL
jgi:transcriptional regulator with XRE-family HTH domain